MESTARKPGTETREPAATTPAELRARPLPRSTEPDETGTTGREATRRAGEPVTAYDHLWFQGRPLT